MPLLQKPNNRWWTGGIFQFTYSPKGLDVLDRYDKYPLGLFINFDNTYRLYSMINLHWLTVEQRRQLMNQLVYMYPQIHKQAEFQRPINFTWDHVKSRFPIARIAWRRYIPTRIRNVQLMNPTWSEEEIEAIINTDTERIIGVTPMMIQKHLQATQERKARAVRQKAREAMTARMSRGRKR